eukprot:NODE_7796_length_742_cov_173.453958_g7545_i0.p1 GENE.NODE_7796_length_742_cov_173.453958_g7545_i0~~NODE_7796_length_742_cov_173.453958_g7545_i0.p1  ORF type:complete len:193 (+),score=52.17 NODE_7796_length_742_cov_173.453958_g7545_i0:71-580(+)
MAFFGLTYCGPQNIFKHHDKEPNEYNTEIKNSMNGADKMPDAFKETAFEKPDTDEHEIFQDDAAYFLLEQQTLKKRPAKCAYVSLQKLKEDKEIRHQKSHADPSQQWNAPITTSQELGWKKPQPQPEAPRQEGPVSGFAGQIGRQHFPIVSSDETRFQTVMIKMNHGVR